MKVGTVRVWSIVQEHVVAVGHAFFMGFLHEAYHVIFVYTNPNDWKKIRTMYIDSYGQGHATVTVLLPGFAINW